MRQQQDQQQQHQQHPHPQQQQQQATVARRAKAWLKRAAFSNIVRLMAEPSRAWPEPGSLAGRAELPARAERLAARPASD